MFMQILYRLLGGKGGFAEAVKAEQERRAKERDETPSDFEMYRPISRRSSRRSRPWTGSTKPRAKANERTQDEQDWQDERDGWREEIDDARDRDLW